VVGLVFALALMICWGIFGELPPSKAGNAQPPGSAPGNLSMNACNESFTMRYCGIEAMHAPFSLRRDFKQRIVRSRIQCGQFQREFAGASAYCPMPKPTKGKNVLIKYAYRTALRLAPIGSRKTGQAQPYFPGT